jgi:hypothetical protein
MGFDIKKFFNDIFAPESGEIITLLIDLPHGEILDNPMWVERRKMAKQWRDNLSKLASYWRLKVNPLVTYLATGAHNSDLPALCKMEGKEENFDTVINGSTIIIAMPEFSCTAPLFLKVKSSKKIRAGSMPGVAKFMEESGLSADYSIIAERCKKLGKIFDKAIAAEVEFSTGHQCYFDLPLENPAHLDDGILHPDRAGTDSALSNLPAGEVYCVPNENSDSKTEGELPEMRGEKIAVYKVKNNRIIDVKGEGEDISRLREKFKQDKAWQNIAEFAIGVNYKAKVTGIVLEDEKAGFHWAYGRSDHFGGKIGVDSFISPANVIHNDIVYAKESPIACKKLEMIFPDNSRQTLILNGELQVE